VKARTHSPEGGPTKARPTASAPTGESPRADIFLTQESAKMTNFLKRLAAGEEGATMVEYALMVALIGAALIAVVGTLSGAIGAKFGSVTTAVNGAAASS